MTINRRKTLNLSKKITIIAATISAALILKSNYCAAVTTEIKQSGYLYNCEFKLPQPWFKPSKARTNQHVIQPGLEGQTETNTIMFENLATKTSYEKYQLEYEKQNTPGSTKYVDIDDNMSATLNFSEGNGQYKFRVYKIPKNINVKDIAAENRKDYIIGKFNKPYVKYSTPKKDSVLAFNHIYDTNGNIFYQTNSMYEEYVYQPKATITTNKRTYDDISIYTVDITKLIKLYANYELTGDYSKALFAVVFKKGEKNPSLDDTITTCDINTSTINIDGKEVLPPSGYFEFTIPNEDPNAIYEIHIYHGGMATENFVCKWEMKPSDF